MAGAGCEAPNPWGSKMGGHKRCAAFLPPPMHLLPWGQASNWERAAAIRCNPATLSGEERSSLLSTGRGGEEGREGRTTTALGRQTACSLLPCGLGQMPKKQ